MERAIVGREGNRKVLNLFQERYGKLEEKQLMDLNEIYFNRIESPLTFGERKDQFRKAHENSLIGLFLRGLENWLLK